MGLPAGRHQVGPENGSLRVKTYREGVAGKAGHDLVLEVTRWQATIDVEAAPEASSLELSADSASLAVREGTGGVKPLTDRDRGEILRTIAAKVLRDQPIAFHSTRVQLDGGSLVADGELAIGTAARPVSARLAVDSGGRISGTIPVTQSDWGIKPYRGLMGALRVRDEVEVVIDAQVGSG